MPLIVRTLADVIADLDAIEDGDTEANHSRADALLLEGAALLGAGLSDAWRRADKRCRFWYA